MKNPLSTNQASLPDGFVPVAGHPDYFVNQEGEVWSAKVRRLLKQEKHDYLYVYTRTNGQRAKVAVHILVAKAFLPNPHPAALAVVRHLDGSRYNCRLSNLEWGTPADNGQDAFLHGSITSDWNHKLTNEEVLTIYRDVHAGTLKQDAIAAKYRVARTTVSAIKNGYIHSSITGASPKTHGGNIGSKNHKAVVDEAKALKIYKRFKNGEKISSISRMHGVSYNVVWWICNGLTWNEVTGLPRKKRQAGTSRSEPDRRKHELRETKKPRAPVPQGLVPLPVPDLRDHYGITQEGVIYSHFTGTVLKINYDGRYPRLGIRFNKQSYNLKVHRLVAKAFIPNPDNHTKVRHLDDDPQNFTISNLAWGNVADNLRDAANNDRVAAVVLSDVDILKIVALVSTGKLTQAEAAQKYGSKKATINKIMLGQSRADLTGLPCVTPGKRKGSGCHQAKLSAKAVRSIVRAVNAGEKKTEIAKRFRVSPSNIKQIMSGNSWSHVTGIVRGK